MAVRLKTEGTRTYLEGFRPLDWGTGEMCEFASALTRTLACVGEDVSYHTVMGVTGVAFRFTMGPELWNPGFYGFEGVSPDVQDLVRRAFSAVGYEYRWYPKSEHADDLKRITESIDRGVAVMLKGCVIDASDWVLVGGYDTDDGLLFGSSPYGKRDKPLPGLDPMPDWHAKTKQYIILGATCERPAAETMYTEALRLAVSLVRTPQDAPPYTGLKAYEVLASALRGKEYPEEAERQEDKPWFRYLCLLCYNMMLDDHKSAPPFLKDAAAALPACGVELARAAECYERGGELRGRLDAILPGNFSQEAQKRVLDPAVREEYAKVILAIRDAEESGISHVERALERRY